MSRFDELSAASRLPIKKDPGTSKVITCVESELIGMSLGLEVWLLDDPLSTRLMTMTDKDCAIDQILGFGPYNNQYGLPVKAITHSAEKEWENKGIYAEKRPQPLCEAPRELRFKAVGKLDLFVDALLVHAQELLAVFDAVRKRQQHC